jgi:iron complex outermembrane receptor protein
MRRKKLVRTAACIVVGSAAWSSQAFAQSTQPEGSSATAPASAQGAPVEAELPSVVVESHKEKPKQKKAKAKKAKATPVATATAPLIATPAGSDNSNVTDRSVFGPVKDYLAKDSATGTKTDTPLREVPQSVSVVGAEQIREQGAQSLQDALRYVPGVVADGYGLDSRTDTTMIRGTEATEFLDGLRRTFSYYTYSYRVDPYFMERVEVLRGPASVLYGQVSVGGIINSVSKRPQNETGGEVSVEYGSFDFKQVKFDVTGPMSTDGKWSYRLTGLARDADTQVDYTPDDRYALQPAITYRPDGNTTITVLGHFQRDRTGSTAQFYPHIGTIFPNVNGKHISWNSFAGEPGDHYNTDVASGTLIVEHKFNSALRIQHSSRFSDIYNDYSAVSLNLDYLDAAQEELSRYRWMSLTSTQVFNQDTNLEAKFGTGFIDHKVLVGVDYTHFSATQGSDYGYADLNPEPFNIYHPVYGQSVWAGVNCAEESYVGTAPPIPGCDSQTVTQTGLYAQDQLRLGNWIAVLGLRHDWANNSTGSSSQASEATTYRAGLMYEFSNGFTPYVSYAESFQPAVGFANSQGDTFDPQQGRSYELGFKYQPTGADFTINSAIYDIKDSGRLVDNGSSYAQQLGEIAIKGFEIELVGRLTKNLKGIAGYSYTDAEYAGGTLAVSDKSDVSGNKVESIPKHLASFWGLWEFDQPELKGWSVGGGVRYIGSSWDEKNTLRTPDVTLFDAMIAYETDHWRWQITGKNLEDKLYYSTCLARGDCFIGTSRTITTGLTYKY